MIDIPNPISSAVVIGSGVHYEDYTRQVEGIFRGHTEFVMSRGELAEFARCPARWERGYKDAEESEATEWGTLVDCMVLTPDALQSRFAVTPENYKDAKTGESKPWTFSANACKEWRNAQGTKMIVKHAKANEAVEAVKALIADDQIYDLVKSSAKQVMVQGQYTDKETGIKVPIRGLIDMVPDKSHERFGQALADLKTCADASPFNWTRAVFSRGYHIQAALYLDLYTAATGEDRVEFLHVIQENYAPYQTARRMLSQEFIECGRIAYLGALQRYCRCLETRQWPGYDPEDSLINGWAITQPEQWMIGK